MNEVLPKCRKLPPGAKTLGVWLAQADKQLSVICLSTYFWTRKIYTHFNTYHLSEWFFQTPNHLFHLVHEENKGISNDELSVCRRENLISCQFELRYATLRSQWELSVRHCHLSVFDCNTHLLRYTINTSKWRRKRSIKAKLQVYSVCVKCSTAECSIWIWEQPSSHYKCPSLSIPFFSNVSCLAHIRSGPCLCKRDMSVFFSLITPLCQSAFFFECHSCWG